MQEIKKILKKRFKGDGQRSIPSTLHISRNNVSKVFKAADKFEFAWVQLQNMDKSQISEILFPEEKCVPIQIMLDFDYVHKELLNPGTSIKGLWQEYIEQCKNASLSLYHRSRFFRTLSGACKEE